MGIFSRGKSVDELYTEASRLEIQEEVSTREANVAEKEAIIKRLKREYGPNWRRLLGVSGSTDLSTLRSFLSGAKKGLTSAGMMQTNNSMLSPIPGRGVPHPVKFEKDRKPTGYYGGGSKRSTDDKE